LVLQWLQALGTNALAGWLGDWSLRQSSTFLKGGEFDEQAFLDAMAEDLHEHLDADNELAEDVTRLLEQIGGIQIALDTLATQGNAQLALLQSLKAELPTLHGRLHELLATEIKQSEERLSAKV